jgi:hypothetical protein
VGKLEGKSQFGIPSRRWDDKIKMNTKETELSGRGQVEFCEHGNEPWGSVKLDNFWSN